MQLLLHLAQTRGSASKLNHVDVFLTKNARSLGAQEVDLQDGGLENVLSAVEEGLKRADHGDTYC